MEVARRGESATSRLADAIGELRAADSESLDRLTGRLDALERRLAALEAAQKVHPNPLPEIETTPLEPDEQGDPRD